MKHKDEVSTEITYCDTWRSLGYPGTPMKYRSKIKPHVEPRITKQQTRLNNKNQNS